MKYVCEIHGPNNKWTFDIDSKEAADKIKQAFVANHSFTITGNGKDTSFNSAMLVCVEFSEKNEDPWSAK